MYSVIAKLRTFPHTADDPTTILRVHLCPETPNVTSDFNSKQNSEALGMLVFFTVLFSLFFDVFFLLFFGCFLVFYFGLLLFYFCFFTLLCWLFLLFCCHFLGSFLLFYFRFFWLLFFASNLIKRNVIRL